MRNRINEQVITKGPKMKDDILVPSFVQKTFCNLDYQSYVFGPPLICYTQVCKSYLLKNKLLMVTPMVQIIVISDDKYPNTTWEKRP